MKVYISPYELLLQKRQNRRLAGSLLLFEFPSGLTGYSDFLPWPQFKEPDLKTQLNEAKAGHGSSRWIVAQNTAFQDACARAEKRSLFLGLKIPASHFLIEDMVSFLKWDLLAEVGYKTLKVKFQGPLSRRQRTCLQSVCKLHPHFRWRLDFNGSLKCGEWEQLKEHLKFLWSRLDFIEDPFESVSRSFASEDAGVFASDWLPHPYSAGGFRIVKPSRDDLKEITKQIPSHQWKGIVFTHSEETLLGQAAAAYQAGTFYRSHPDFYTIGSFKSFSCKKSPWTFQVDFSPQFKPPGGFGLGFQRLLEKEPWRRWI